VALVSAQEPILNAIEQPTDFNPVINLATAKAIGLTILDKLLSLAETVIEQTSLCALFAALHESVIVLVFGRRDDGRLQTTR
jgi:hypothetical protein